MTCYYDGQKANQPCWGEELFLEDDGTTEIFVCQGHKTMGAGEVSNYIPRRDLSRYIQNDMLMSRKLQDRFFHRNGPTTFTYAKSGEVIMQFGRTNSIKQSSEGLFEIKDREGNCFTMSPHQMMEIIRNIHRP